MYIYIYYTKFLYETEVTNNSITIQNGSEPETRKQNYWFGHQFLVKVSLQNSGIWTWRSNTELKSNCYNSERLHWISTSCLRRSVHKRKGLIKMVLSSFVGICDIFEEKSFKSCYSAIFRIAHPGLIRPQLILGFKQRYFVNLVSF